MTVFEIIFGIIIMLMAAFLVVAVLMQSGKEKGLSGSIVGSGDSFFGKSKKAKQDALLSTITTVLSVVFAVLTIVMYIVIVTK